MGGKWWKHEKDVGVLNHQADIGLVKGCSGGVGRRVGGGAGCCWVVGEGASRLRRLRVREKVHRSPRCRRKGLSPLEGAFQGEGGSKNSGPRIAIPPPCCAPGVFGGHRGEERWRSLSSASPKASKSP